MKRIGASLQHRNQPPRGDNTTNINEALTKPPQRLEPTKDDPPKKESSMKMKTYTPVFLLCKCGKPLMPTTAPKARILLKHSKAKVFRLYPFTIQLNYETQHNTQPVDLRIDYGAKMHGIALVQQCKTHDRAIFLGEAKQRQDVKKKMDIRRELRKLRRNRKTRYRKPRFVNRRRPEGWTPPTISQRVEAITRIAKTLQKLTSITSAITETGMFDTQRIVNQDVKGTEYQFGPGYGYENRRHAVLAYFNYTCQYCGTFKGIMTEEHVIPKVSGGTDAWSNLTCACLECNKKKGNRTPEEAGMPNPRTVNPRDDNFLKFCSLAQSGKNKLLKELQKLATTQTVHGWQTKQNREVTGLPKTHYYDALCTRTVTEKPLILTSTIHGIRLRRRNIRRTHYSNSRKGGKRQPYNHNKYLSGFRKGDLVRSLRGQGYVEAISSRGQLYCVTANGRRYRVSTSTGQIKLVERSNGIHVCELSEERRT